MEAEEQKHQLGTTAQGVEAEGSVDQMQQVVQHYQSKLAHMQHSPAWYPVDPNYIFDEWAGYPDTPAAGTFSVTLDPAVDRPILINSFIIATATGSTNVVLTIVGEDMPRKIPLGAGLQQLSAVAFIIYPQAVITLTYTTAGAATGGFMEAMGLGLRGDLWRRY
jgi:hypothetical protein